MNINIFDAAGKAVSCMVSTFIVFRYFNKRYQKNYSDKWIYRVAMVVTFLIILIINFINNPLVNLASWIIMISVIGHIFYNDNQKNNRNYYLVNIVFILAISTCESLGIVFCSEIIKFVTATDEIHILDFIKQICGSVVAIFTYYLILDRLFVPKRTNEIPVKQYMLYALFTSYVLINIGEILFFTKHELSNRDYMFLLVDSIFIVFINLYLFYLLENITENRELRHKITLYEKQAKYQYDHYQLQKEMYDTVMKIVHDAKKHMNVIEKLYESGEIEKGKCYMESFDKLELPLMAKYYCKNTILNIIINDKASYCSKKDINFNVEIYEIDLDFMEPIDMTTVFGNILDNALEACENTAEKFLHLKVYPFNSFIFVKLMNTYSKEISWNNKGTPVSGKGEGHGIGLENVEIVLRKYNGSIWYSIEEGLFKVEMMFNQK